jgi:hypothetical protein
MSIYCVQALHSGTLKDHVPFISNKEGGTLVAMMTVLGQRRARNAAGMHRKVVAIANKPKRDVLLAWGQWQMAQRSCSAAYVQMGERSIAVRGSVSTDANLVAKRMRNLSTTTAWAWVGV